MNIISKDTRVNVRYVVGSVTASTGYQPLSLIAANCKYAFVELWVVTDTNTAQQCLLNNSIGNISSASAASVAISGSSTGVISGIVTPTTTIGGAVTSATVHRKFMRITEYF